MNRTPQTLCPPPDRLAQLVTGSLIEHEAERLFQHIDRCSSCQFQMDEIARRNDPKIKVAGRPRAVAEDNADLSKLIRLAQGKPGEGDTKDRKVAQTKVISAVDFVAGLKKSGLIEGQELSQILSDLSWDASDAKGDSNSLARALIHQQKLTTFQARLLLRGRWQGLVLGNYAILDKLGQGGMGAVFKARHIRMGRVVCLKVVNSAGRQSPAVIERFRNEARALAALSHPNIVVAHDADEAKGIPYLVMEFIDGDDLAKRVRKNGPLSIQEAMETAIQTGRALWYAHGQGVVHRDIKPHNLVSTRDDESGELFVKVLDLGLARFDTLMTDNPDASVMAAMTNTGVVIGTVDYMAPEQALDSRNADARSDIYSLGCTLFFLLSGRPPFSGETVMQRLIAHREQSAPDLSILVEDVTVDLNAVVHKMLAKDPTMRYQTMDQAISDLQAVSQGHSPSVKAPDALVRTDYIEPLKTVTPESEALGTEIQLELRNDESQTTNDRRSKGPFHVTRHIAFGLAIAASIVGLLGLAYDLMPRSVPIALPPLPRIGSEQAIRNGGDGRAVVLVSSIHFDKDQFFALERALDERDVNLVFASSGYGGEKPEAYPEIRSQYENMHLRDVKATDFDSVFILSGKNRELSHKVPENHGEVKRLVREALENQIMVSGCGDGYHSVLKDSGVIFEEKFKHPRYSYEICDNDSLVKQANQIFDELIAQREPLSSGDSLRK